MMRTNMKLRILDRTSDVGTARGIINEMEQSLTLSGCEALQMAHLSDSIPPSDRQAMDNIIRHREMARKQEMNVGPRWKDKCSFCGEALVPQPGLCRGCKGKAYFEAEARTRNRANVQHINAVASQDDTWQHDGPEHGTGVVWGAVFCIGVALVVSVVIYREELAAAIRGWMQ